MSNINYHELNSSINNDKGGKSLKNIKTIQSSSNMNKQKKNKLRRCATHKDESAIQSRNYKTFSIKHTTSFNGNNFQKINKNPFQDELKDAKVNNQLNLTQSKRTKHPLNINFASKYSYNSSNEKSKKTIAKKSPIVNQINRNKKRTSNNLLSKISFNIQKTNQNLNNPEEFYSNYFNSLLEGDSTVKNMSKELSMKVLPILKREKNFLKRNFTLKKQ